MAHYAKVLNGVVTRVIVADQDFIDNMVEQEAGEWLQTSYNTVGGEHLNGGTPLRKNYAGVGFTYDAERDAFIPPQPYASWKLDETSCTWQPPTPHPDDGLYRWDEETTSWVAE